MAKITITLPDDLLESVDHTAKIQQRTRNDVLRDAAEKYLRNQGKLHRWEDPIVLQAVATQDQLASELRGDNWDVVQEIRCIRESRR